MLQDTNEFSDNVIQQLVSMPSSLHSLLGSMAPEPSYASSPDKEQVRQAARAGPLTSQPASQQLRIWGAQSAASALPNIWGSQVGSTEF